MATTLHALIAGKSGIAAALAAQPDTAAARVVELLIEQDTARAFREAQRARNDMEDALSLIRGLLSTGPNPQALTLLARDAAEFVARAEARS